MDQLCLRSPNLGRNKSLSVACAAGSWLSGLVKDATRAAPVMNSTEVQNPRRKMHVLLLAEPKTPPGLHNTMSSMVFLYTP